MSKIKKLTDEQIKRFPEFIQEWTNTGLSTDPADRPRAEAAVKWIYAQANLPEPKIVWTTSPLVSGLTRFFVTSEKFKKEIGKIVRASVRDSVWDSVRASVWASVGAFVRDSVWDSVRASVWASVGASVRDSVWASVRDSVGASVRDSVYGQHDAGWLAFYFYFHEVLHLKNHIGKLNGLWELCRSSGWALPHEKICWISERHNILNRDERGRLHSETGAALSYPDNWSIYAVHGVRVPQDIILDPSSITVERIEKEANTEIRRVMIGRYKEGAKSYMLDSGAKLIHECGDIHTGLPLKLWRKERLGDSPLVMVEMQNKSLEPNGERKIYYIRVEPTITDALTAVAWHQNMDKAAYKKMEIGT